MNREELLKKLAALGITDKDAFWGEAFSRDIGLLTRPEQLRLAGARVAIPGMGGVGGVHMVTLIRAGIGKFHLSDFDVYELANMNRQFGATVSALGRPKIDVMEDVALDINPFLDIKKFPEGINEKNVDAFLEGVDVVIDGIDFFAFGVRRLIFNRAMEKGVPVVTAGPLGFSSAMLIFMPGGMSFDGYFDLKEGQSAQEQLWRFLIGLAPRATHRHYTDLSRVSFSRKRGPSLDLACQLCSAVAVTEAIRLILGRPGLQPVPRYHQLDLYRHQFVSGKLRWGNRGPLQRLKLAFIRRQFAREKLEFKRLPPAHWPSRRVAALPVPDEIMDSIVTAGTYAPSILNIQPWRVERRGNRVEVALDPARSMAAADNEDLGRGLSIGAFLENMRVAATTFGLETRFSPLSDGRMGRAAEFVPGPVPRDFLFDSLWDRHTNRGAYRRETLPPALFQALEGSLKPFPGARLHWLKTPEEVRRIYGLTYISDRIRVENPALHQDIYKMFRWTMEEVMEKLDGFPLGNLGAGTVGEIFLRLTKSWRVMEFLNRLGLGSRLVARHVARDAASSPAVALLTMEGEGSETYIEAGRAMERFWLALTHQGYVMQPLTPINYFWHQHQARGAESFPPGLRPLLAPLWEKYFEIFPLARRENETHVMLVRIGQAPPMRWASPRRGLDRITTPLP